MTFDYTTLITDRTQSDVDRVKYLAQRVSKGTATETERAEYLTDLKGAYNASDLNRVTAAMEYLKELYDHYGYAVNYTPVYIDRTATPTSRLPEGYTEVEYIQSSGTQYVDTGFKPNQDTRAVLDFQFVDTSTITWFFGVQQGWQNAMFDLAMYAGSNLLHSGYGTAYENISSLTDKARYTVDKNKNVTTIGGASYTSTANEFQSQVTAVIFAYQAPSGVSSFSKLKLYSCQIYDDDTLVRNFIPCINADNAVGLYDLANDKFYGNAGTGTFTAGDAVTWDEDTSDSGTDLDPYTWYVSDIPTDEQMVLLVNNLHAFWESVESANGNVAAIWSNNNFGYVDMSTLIGAGDYVSMIDVHGIVELSLAVRSSELSNITATGDGWNITKTSSLLTAKYTVPNGKFQDIQSALDSLMFHCTSEEYADAIVIISAVMRSGSEIEIGSGTIRWSAIINWIAFESYGYTWENVETVQMTWQQFEMLPIPLTGG